MTKKEMDGLREGDVVRSLCKGEGFRVAFNYGNRVTVVRTTDITCPHEWVTEKGLLAGISELVSGDEVRHVGSGRVYIVTSVHPESLGGHATGVQTREIAEENLAEWEIG